MPNSVVVRAHFFGCANRPSATRTYVAACCLHESASLSRKLVLAARKICNWVQRQVIRKEKVMFRRIKRSVTLAGLSAGLMYFFDPDLGRRRRSWLSDQFQHLDAKFRRAIDVLGRDLQNRLHGMTGGGSAGSGEARSSRKGQASPAAGSNAPQGASDRRTVGSYGSDGGAMPDDQLVDEASEESFPASDAPSFTRR